MSTTPSPRKSNGSNDSMIRLYPRGEQPLHAGMKHITSHLASYPNVSKPQRSRMSPRHVKLQRMEPSLPYTIAVPLRGQVSTNFRHELFHFHQLLRDVIKSEEFESHRSVVQSRDIRILDLLTSDRGDAVLKEFFVRCQRALKCENMAADYKEDDGFVLWEVLQTFFANLPLVFSEGDLGVASSPKAFCRYVDSLSSLRDLLLALLFKRPPGTTNDSIDGESDEESSSGMHSSFGLDFGRNFNDRTPNLSPRSSQSSTSCSQFRHCIPMYLHCQQLERELEALRRRASGQNPNGSGIIAHDLGEAGLMQDNTMTLLLAFYALPREERLTMFCQIASQANEQDTSAILRVFLDNCTTSTFTQIWETLQYSPHVIRMLRETSPQVTVDLSENPTINLEKVEAALLIEPIHVEKPLIWQESQRGMKMQGRRTPRSIDLNSITEVSDFAGHGSDHISKMIDDSKLKAEDLLRDTADTLKSSVHEENRHLLSNATDYSNEEAQNIKRGSCTRSDQSQRILKPPTDREGVPLLRLLHDDLTEVTKMKDKPDARVMIAVRQLLEALDGQGTFSSKTDYHRRAAPHPGPAIEMPVQLQQPQPQDVTETPRASLRTPLSIEQDYLMQLDQLQSLLLALTDVHVHTMSTEAITGAYRRMQMLSKLFSALADKSFGAAGVEPTSSLTTFSNHEKAQSIETSVDSVDSKMQPLTPNDSMREDVEAMSQLLVKLSRFVRSLAPLVDSEDSAPSSVSTSDDVLTIMDLATKLEQAGTLVQVPIDLTRKGGGKRRLSLAADRELPVLLAVQSLARSSTFELVSQKIAAAVEDKLTRVRLAAVEATRGDEEEVDACMAMEGDEVMMRIVSSVRRATKEVQMQEMHDQMRVQSGASYGESDDTIANALRIGKSDLSINGKKRAALRGVKLFSVDILLRFVNQLYRDIYEGMVSTQQYGNRRMEFGEFVYDWHIRKYGLKSLAQRHLLKLIQSLRKHEKKVFQCQLCLRFMGGQDPLGFHELKFVLGLLSRWSLGTFSGPSKHRVECSKRQFKVRIAFAIPSVQEALRERFGIYARGLDALSDRIRTKACLNDDEFICESDLLTLCVEEFASQRALIMKVLGAVYQAGDTNGDGSLEFDEFASVVTHLSPTADDRFLQKVFEAAYDFTKPPRISFARFLDVVLLERVLCPASLSAAATGTARAKNAGTTAAGTSLAASTSAMDDLKSVLHDDHEETYQLELLCETWAHDREAVTHVLETSITHAPTAKSLSFRVAFLDQLLDRRVDAKTAWLCHRQIMREIARYQHLDVDQIAGLRRKDQQFKKAVRAIQNVQRMSALFPGNVLSDDESNVEVSNVNPNYAAAVQLSLDAQEEGMANTADVVALENELRDTFLERADGGAIDDYMAALQHLRRASMKQDLLLQISEAATPIIDDILSEGYE